LANACEVQPNEAQHTAYRRDELFVSHVAYLEWRAWIGFVGMHELPNVARGLAERCHPH
jgi:hypothetical protein